MGEKHNETALLGAAEGGHLAVVKMLLAAKAEVNKATTQMVSPLMLAAQVTARA